MHKPRAISSGVKTVTLTLLMSLLAAVLLLGDLRENTKIGIYDQESAPVNKKSPAMPINKLEISKKTLDVLNPKFRKKMMHLLNLYRNQIEMPQVQASLLELRDYILNFYPSKGQAIFNELLLEVFPTYATNIINMLKKMDEYNRWIFGNSEMLSKLNETENNEKLWKKRIALFGRDAYQVWSGKLTAYEQRKQNARKTLKLLEISEIISNEEKLHRLQLALEQIYSHRLEGYNINKSLLSSLYLGIDSVQKELIQLPAKEQQQQLKHVRRRMGYTDSQIEKMEKIDEKRNQRWKNGLSYMTERDLLVDQVSDEELAYHLTILREKYFQHEAKTIEQEEQGGFYRYLRPRIIGRN